MDMQETVLWNAIPDIVLAAPVDNRSSSWSGHVPFAFWVIDALRPMSLVELGTWYGMSYLAFCQAIVALDLQCRAMAVDTWQGDHQTGKIAEDALASLKEAHDPKYGSFSQLNRATFQQAVSEVADGSIDLLHVDGLHTYEAVREDYESWLPKMSQRGVMLFHDTRETHDDFGVYKLWAELSAKYESFEFHHEHGLGVLGVGADQAPAMKALFASSKSDQSAGKVRELFSRLGAPYMFEREREQIARMQQSLDLIGSIPEIRASLKLRRVFK